MGSSSKAENTISKTEAAAGSLRLADHVCLFLDCQTTGASVTSGGNLLEVAWCDGSSSSLPHSFSAIAAATSDTNASSSEILSRVQSYLVKQPEESSIPGRIKMLTGITDDDMVSAVDAREILNFLFEKSKEVSQPQLCVMHYARFETHFLTHLVAEHGQGQEWPYQNICTFEIARRLYPNLPSRGIRALGGFLGLDMEEVKRSNSHVEATRVIWKHLVEQLAEIGVETLDQLQELLATKAGARSGPLEYKLERLKRLELPSCPGVYRMLNQSGRVLYVGKATSLKSRVNSHFRGRKRKTSKSKELLTQVASIEVTECGSPLEAALLETDEIKRFDPPYNISLKKRNRNLLFASWDFLSFSHEQDEEHVIGPLPNYRALDALLRLSVTINSGVVDPHVLFVEIPVEDLAEGIEIFVGRHALSFEDGTTPRDLLALGLRLFRTTKRLLRQMALEQARAIELAKALQLEQLNGGAIGLNENSSAEAASLNFSLNESSVAYEVSSFSEATDTADDAAAAAADVSDDALDDDLDVDFDGDDLTPEEIATKFESLLIGVARTYLASKDLTDLLNSNISFTYKKNRREVFVRNGRLVSECDGKVNLARGNDLCDQADRAWAGMDVRDYDRMRVLLTEVTRMYTDGQDIEIQPPLRFLSRW
jgi:DNA polymerase-3 subunit epsilon